MKMRSLLIIYRIFCTMLCSGFKVQGQKKSLDYKVLSKTNQSDKLVSQTSFNVFTLPSNFSCDPQKSTVEGYT